MSVRGVRGGTRGAVGADFLQEGGGPRRGDRGAAAP